MYLIYQICLVFLILAKWNISIKPIIKIVDVPTFHILSVNSRFVKNIFVLLIFCFKYNLYFIGRIHI